MKDDLKKSKQIVKYEYSQLWLGFIFIIILICVGYVFEVKPRYGKNDKPIVILILLGLLLVYKFQRYRHHKKIIENIDKTKEESTEPEDREEFKKP